MIQTGSEIGMKLSKTNQLSSYSFRWLKASMTNDEVFERLQLLESGKADFNSLNKLGKLNAKSPSK